MTVTVKKKRKKTFRALSLLLGHTETTFLVYVEKINILITTNNVQEKITFLKSKKKNIKKNLKERLRTFEKQKQYDGWTLRHEDGADGEDAADDHADAQDPAAPPPVHDDPAEEVGGHLHGT